MMLWKKQPKNIIMQRQNDSYKEVRSFSINIRKGIAGSLMIILSILTKAAVLIVPTVMFTEANTVKTLLKKL